MKGFVLQFNIQYCYNRITFAHQPGLYLRTGLRVFVAQQSVRLLVFFDCRESSYRRIETVVCIIIIALGYLAYKNCPGSGSTSKS